MLSYSAKTGPLKMLVLFEIFLYKSKYLIYKKNIKILKFIFARGLPYLDYKSLCKFTTITAK